MINVYPFGSGSVYTASFALTSSYAVSASFLNYAISASKAEYVLNPQQGIRGKSVCLITYAEYQDLLANPLTRIESCSYNGVPL